MPGDLADVIHSMGLAEQVLLFGNLLGCFFAHGNKEKAVCKSTSLVFIWK
ncbi:hypothetical protein [Stutzerimonas nitrititolerans]|nr:hypothetical protein [Stutzerimonas nitrititolerans]